MTRSGLLRWGRILIALSILYFLIKHLLGLLTTLEGEVVVFKPFWLLAAFTSLLLYFVLLGIPWLFLYRAGREKPVPLLSGWTFFQLSQLGRYLPGRVGQVVWMLSFSRGFGIEKTSAVLATCLQLAFQCSLGCLFGCLILWHTETAQLLQNVLASLEMSVKTGLICIGIGTLGGGVVFLYRDRIQETFSRLIEQGAAMFSMSTLLLSLGVYLLLWGLLGTAFFLFIKSLCPISVSQLLVVTGIYAVAWSIGFLSVITPSGLGVREGVLSLLLTTVLPPATATLVALLARLWTLAAELLLGGVAFGIYFRQRRV
ncbi:MAG: lysylphosphatidylglycerol synthase domain-containing protein [Candidatus Poribacteria bacterium]|nr:lysylphosphatidylglycerol synthase domain-containing protein [Candidatus Poribacteria bacterium]